MNYLLPIIDYEKLNDNISCMGQVLSLFGYKGSHISFLACAELGSHIDELEISYLSGSIDKKTLKISSWIGKAGFGEKIVWSGAGVEISNNKPNVYSFPVNIYEYEIPIREEEIYSIKLPYLPNIHIFALSVVTKFIKK